MTVLTTRTCYVVGKKLSFYITLHSHLEVYSICEFLIVCAFKNY